MIWYELLPEEEIDYQTGVESDCISPKLFSYISTMGAWDSHIRLELDS